MQSFKVISPSLSLRSGKHTSFWHTVSSHTELCYTRHKQTTNQPNNNNKPNPKPKESNKHWTNKENINTTTDLYQKPLVYFWKWAQYIKVSHNSTSLHFSLKQIKTCHSVFTGLFVFCQSLGWWSVGSTAVLRKCSWLHQNWWFLVNWFLLLLS